MTGEARKALSDKREQLCADRLDNSFSTSYTVQDISGNFTATITGGDGLAFASAVHTREDGGTAWSNRVTDGVVPSAKETFSQLFSFNYPLLAL